MTCTSEEMERMQRAVYKEVLEIMEAIIKEHPRDMWQTRWFDLGIRLGKVAND